MDIKETIHIDIDLLFDLRNSPADSRFQYRLHLINPLLVTLQFVDQFLRTLGIPGEDILIDADPVFHSG
jgi:hypothetical protein